VTKQQNSHTSKKDAVPLDFMQYNQLTKQNVEMKKQKQEAANK
jgi:hypothetical protein